MSTYIIYERYRDILELLNNEDCTVKEMSDKLNICINTIHAYVRELLDKNIIKAVSHYTDEGSFGHKARIFRIVKK